MYVCVCVRACAMSYTFLVEWPLVCCGSPPAITLAYCTAITVGDLSFFKASTQHASPVTSHCNITHKGLQGPNGAKLACTGVPELIMSYHHHGEGL